MQVRLCGSGRSSFRRRCCWVEAREALVAEGCGKGKASGCIRLLEWSFCVVDFRSSVSFSFFVSWLQSESSRGGVFSRQTDTMPALQAHRSGGSFKGHEAVLDNESSSTDSDPFVQNLFVLRHGEVGSGEDDGEGGAWDPPLTNRGKMQAWQVGRDLRMEDWNITRVVMSPFLRCVQTAAEVIAGLCLLPSSLEQGVCANAASRSVPAIKASIEFGLAEAMKRQGISRPLQVAHNSSLESWTLDLSELFSLLPSETYDTSYQPIRQTLPSYRESAADMQSRYTTTLQKIANRFHSEHILCITHDEGVMKAVSMMWPRVEMCGVMFCAHIHAQRPNFNCEDGSSLHSGEWELLTESGSSSGIFYAPL